MEKIRIGVIGLGRGGTFVTPYESLGIEVAAICDFNKDKLAMWRERLGSGVKGYTEYDEMIASDIDAVILCNYFDEHAPFAIKALKAGKHVMSECTCNSTIAEGVALCRAVEESGKIYMIAENYPYTRCGMELRRIYKAGELGEAMYGDGEYNHPMSADVINSIAPGRYHWRNTLPPTYYCTHAYAPLMYATDTMPRRISAFSASTSIDNLRDLRKGTAVRGDIGAVIMCQMDNGAVFKEMGVGFPGHRGYYRIHGTLGAAEIVGGGLHVWHDGWNTPEGMESDRTYMPEWAEYGELANNAGHGGGDFWTPFYFAKAIRENKQPIMDVYFGVAVSSIGILAWKSALANGQPFDMPDFRDEAVRKLHENDVWNPILKEGMDKNAIPPASTVGYEPSEEDIKAAEVIWEKTKYWGLG